MTKMAMPRHIPTNKGELELYKVLQRANVLQYYDVFISQGGDDVRQLCEAGEEEFLEIMALVGMASKPLHVRRLQKALQEWLRSPGSLLQHAPGPPLGSVGTTPVAPGALKALMGLQIPPMQHSPPQQRMPQNMQQHARYMRGPSPRKSPPGDGLHMPVVPGTGQMIPKNEMPSPSPTALDGNENQYNGHSPVHTTAVSLTETQIKSIKEAAALLVQNLPPLDPKPYNTMKKAYCQEIQNILKLAPNDDARMSGIRRYSAIYGRSDSKRKFDKPMTLHEISINEAAAQLCHLVPELLTRRDELFPLARQVVRNSGNQYLRGMSEDDSQGAKRMRSDNGEDDMSFVSNDLEHMQQEILSDIVRDLTALDYELDKMRGRLESAKSTCDLALEQSLLQDLNALVVRRQQLTDQQNVLLSSRHKYVMSQNYSNGNNGNSTNSHKPAADDSDTSHSLVSSPRDSNPGEDQHGDRELDLSLNANKPNNHNESLEKILIDEGLRIAQKFGMNLGNDEKDDCHVITSGETNVSAVVKFENLDHTTEIPSKD